MKTAWLKLTIGFISSVIVWYCLLTSLDGGVCFNNSTYVTNPVGFYCLLQEECVNRDVWRSPIVLGLFVYL